MLARTACWTSAFLAGSSPGLGRSKAPEGERQANRRRSEFPTSDVWCFFRSSQRQPRFKSRRRFLPPHSDLAVLFVLRLESINELFTLCGGMWTRPPSGARAEGRISPPRRIEQAMAAVRQHRSNAGARLLATIGRLSLAPARAITVNRDRRQGVGVGWRGLRRSTTEGIGMTTIWTGSVPVARKNRFAALTLPTKFQRFDVCTAVIDGRCETAANSVLRASALTRLLRLQRVTYPHPSPICNVVFHQ
jgi:hypothetical protein